MLQVDNTIRDALMDFSLTVPDSNTDWFLICQIGPLNIFAKWFEQGKVEIQEKINCAIYSNYIKSLPFV